MKIVLITSSFPRFAGDFQGNFIWYLASEQVKKGNAVHVICPHVPGSPFHDTMNGITIHRFPYFFPTRLERMTSETGMHSAFQRSFLAVLQCPLFLLSLWFHAFRIMKREHFDVIHTHWLVPAGLIGALLSWCTGIPHIATIHGSDLNILKGYSVLYPICRFITRHSTTITVNSQYMQRQLIRVTPDCERKVRVISMGVDPSLFLPVRENDTNRRNGHYIISVCRLIDWKGLEYLVRAIPSVVEQCPNTRLLIAGTGPEYDSLARLSIDLGIADNVEFLGFVPFDGLLSIYHSADVFVLPSISLNGMTEAFGVVLLEAMASGCPVIGSNVGGIPDIICDGENGFLVPERDPKMLGSRIVRVLSDESLQKKFRENGIRCVQDRFTWDTVAIQFLHLYSESCSTPPREESVYT